MPPLLQTCVCILGVLCTGYQIASCTTTARNPKTHRLDVRFSLELNDTLLEGKTRTVNVLVATPAKWGHVNSVIAVVSSNPDIAQVELVEVDVDNSTQDWNVSFSLTGKFLGYTKIRVQQLVHVGPNASLVAESEPVQVAVIREPQVLDQAFSFTIAALVSLAFVNLGCSLDLEVVKSSLKKPVGPIIGFVCQYLFMPLCAFGLSKVFLSHNAALQLGLFVTGCSPGGGGSNIWTFILGGNLNLSITMTCLSTVVSFAMMPLWTLTLGRLVFSESDIVVPYSKVATLAALLAIPLLIGITVRRFFAKTGLFLVKMLKPLSALFIVVVVGFGTYANLFLFQLMDWRVLVCGMLLPWLGYVFGAVASCILRQPWSDALAIAIETGVQNTGIAIFILRVTLEQPAADINTAVPVAVALMTPIPLLTMWAVQRCCQRLCRGRQQWISAGEGHSAPCAAKAAPKNNNIQREPVHDPALENYI